MTDSFNITYDAGGDVLYINRRGEAASHAMEDQYGIVWRYDKDGELIGATIMDFMDVLMKSQYLAPPLLADQISFHFNIPQPEAVELIERAAKGRRVNPFMKPATQG